MTNQHHAPRAQNPKSCKTRKQPAADATDHDAAQDHLIRNNQDAIKNIQGKVEELRNHFLKKGWGLFLEVCGIWIPAVGALIAIAAGAIAFWEWRKLGLVAEQYANAGWEHYEETNNPDVALPFIDKAISLVDKTIFIEGNLKKYYFDRAYIEGMSHTRPLLNLDRPLNKTELNRAHQTQAEANRLIKLSPDDARPYILKGQVLLALKEYKDAHSAIKNALSNDHANVSAHVCMAKILLGQGEITKAEKSLEAALAVDRQSKRAKWTWLWKGIVANDDRCDPEAARACYEEALGIDPKFDMAHYNRGLTFIAGTNKNYVAARDEMYKVIKLNPAYKEAYYFIGRCYGHEDKYDVARIWLDKAIALDENYLTAHKWRGIICGQTGAYEESVRSFDAAIRLNPRDADLYVRRARQETSLKRYDDALRDLRFAEEQIQDNERKRKNEPNCSDELTRKKRIVQERRHLWKGFGDLHLALGDYDTAITNYVEAIALGGQHEDALAGMAAALAAQKRFEEAREKIDKAIEMTTYKPWRFELQKGEILEKEGKSEEALALYRKVRESRAEMSARDRAAVWRREASLQKGRDTNACRTALKKYVELVPTDMAARQELQSLP